jgi:hypothetical protein
MTFLTTPCIVLLVSVALGSGAQSTPDRCQLIGGSSEKDRQSEGRFCEVHKLLPPADEASESVLAKIDWYGDTYFNYLQIKRFLEEWDQLEQRAETSEEKALIVGVRQLAVRCQDDRNLLRFIGD